MGQRRALRQVPQPVQLRHVDRVLQDEGHLARMVEERRMGRAPKALLESLPVRQGNGIFDQWQVIRRLLADDLLEGAAQLPVARRIRIARKGVEHVAPDQVLALRAS